MLQPNDNDSTDDGVVRDGSGYKNFISITPSFALTWLTSRAIRMQNVSESNHSGLRCEDDVANTRV